MPRAASSVGVGRRVKRETALVSYNDLDATLTGNINGTPPSFEYFWLLNISSFFYFYFFKKFFFSVLFLGFFFIFLDSALRTPHSAFSEQPISEKPIFRSIASFSTYYACATFNWVLLAKKKLS